MDADHVVLDKGVRAHRSASTEEFEEMDLPRSQMSVWATFSTLTSHTLPGYSVDLEGFLESVHWFSERWGIRIRIKEKTTCQKQNRSSSSAVQTAAPETISTSLPDWSPVMCYSLSKVYDRIKATFLAIDPLFCLHWYDPWACMEKLKWRIRQRGWRGQGGGRGIY